MPMTAAKHTPLAGVVDGEWHGKPDDVNHNAVQNVAAADGDDL